MSSLITIDEMTGTVDGKTTACKLIDVSSNGMGATYIVEITINGKSQERPVTLEKGREMMSQFRTKIGA